jgi:hypothetical protein
MRDYKYNGYDLEPLPAESIPGPFGPGKQEGATSPKPLFQRIPSDMPGNTDLSDLLLMDEAEGEGATYILPADEGTGAADSGSNSGLYQPKPKPNLLDRVAYYWEALRPVDKRNVSLALAVSAIAAVFALVFALVMFIKGPAAPIIPPARPARLEYSIKTQLDYQRQFTTSEIAALGLSKSFETDLVLSDVQPATAEIQIPNQRAEGQVRLFNPNERNISFSAGTTFITLHGIAYKLKDSVTIPATSVANGSSGFAVATIYADRAGPDGNVPGGMGSFSLGSGVRGAGIGPVDGGTTRPAKTPARADLDAINKRLTDQAGPKAAELSTTLIPAGWRVLGSVNVQNLSFSSDIQPGQEAPGAQLNGKLTAKVKLVAYNPQATLDALPSLPVASVGQGQGAPQLKDVSLDQSGNLLVNYYRAIDKSLVTGALNRQIAGWSGNRQDLDTLLAALQARPELDHLTVASDTPLAPLPDYPGKYAVSLVPVK